MEIRQVVRGGAANLAPARRTGRGEAEGGGAVRPSADRVELSRQWVEAMEEQRARSEGALWTGKKEEKSNGILDMLDGGAGQEELDAQTEALKTQQKCMEIAMNIMRGKRVPPQDEQYLLEHDPDAYKLAMAARALVKVDDEECESVLDDEDKKTSQPPGTGEAASAETGEAVSSDSGEAASSEGE